MKINDNQEVIDISDYNFVEVKLKIIQEKCNQFTKKTWEVRQYYSTEKENLLEIKLHGIYIDHVSTLNNMIMKEARDVL